MSELSENPRVAAEGRARSLAPIRILTKVVKIGSPLSLLAHRPTENAFALSSADGDAAGVGEVEVLSADGPSRFFRLAQAAESLFSRLVLDGRRDAPPARLYGGMSFQPGAATSPCWRGFGEARFVLPRVRYLRSGHSAWLSLAMRVDESAQSAALELEAAEEALLRPPACPVVPSSPAPVVAVEQLDETHWCNLVRAAQAVMDAGEIEKVVLARCARFVFERPIDVDTVLSAIFAEQSTRFMFRLGGVTFAGATPERLVARAGRRVLTEALAGTIASRNTVRSPQDRDTDRDAVRALLESAKDREEHAVVVRHIAAVLDPLCAPGTLRVPAEPVTRAFGHLIHLHTPIEGELRADTHLLSLAHVLHPTPAVGGTPTAHALSFIRECEPVPRGWYAAPLGWFDAAGDGELYIGLRSGLISGTSAFVYAGAGIMRDSDPAAEYAETALKQRVFGRALGLALEL